MILQVTANKLWLDYAQMFRKEHSTVERTPPPKKLTGQHQFENVNCFTQNPNLL